MPKPKKSRKTYKILLQGGQRVMRGGAMAEVFTRHGDKLERESPGGEQTQVSHLLDPRLNLTIQQRATGQCFGAYAEAISGSQGGGPLREYVDRSFSSGSGATDRRIHMMRMIEVARRAAEAHPMIVYPLGRTRGLGHVGSHRAVKPLTLLESVCVGGFSLGFVAVSNGWVSERAGGKDQGKTVVPGRQRAHLSEALRCILDAVFDEWDERGYIVPFEFTRLVVK